MVILYLIQRKFAVFLSCTDTDEVKQKKNKKQYFIKILRPKNNEKQYFIKILRPKYNGRKLMFLLCVGTRILKSQTCYKERLLLEIALV